MCQAASSGWGQGRCPMARGEGSSSYVNKEPDHGPVSCVLEESAGAVSRAIGEDRAAHGGITLNPSSRAGRQCWPGGLFTLVKTGQNTAGTRHCASAHAVEVASTSFAFTPWWASPQHMADVGTHHVSHTAISSRCSGGHTPPGRPSGCPHA